MRVWIDMTAPAHVLVFRPLVEIMRERGDEVRDHRARLRADASSCSRCTGSRRTR